MSDWQPIDSAPRCSCSNPECLWIPRLLAGKMRPWGWEEWVAQRDEDIWLGRDGEGGCFECDEPSHWAALPEQPELFPPAVTIFHGGPRRIGEE